MILSGGKRYRAKGSSPPSAWADAAAGRRAERNKAASFLMIRLLSCVRLSSEWNEASPLARRAGLRVRPPRRPEPREEEPAAGREAPPPAFAAGRPSALSSRRASRGSRASGARALGEGGRARRRARPTQRR